MCHPSLADYGEIRDGDAAFMAFDGSELPFDKTALGLGDNDKPMCVGERQRGWKYE
jgi:hypothetical protein